MQASENFFAVGHIPKWIKFQDNYENDVNQGLIVQYDSMYDCFGSFGFTAYVLS